MIFIAINWSLPFWAWILILIGTLVIGFILGLLVSRKITAKYLQNNPPITEAMIKTMYRQMGRTPSEKQIRQVMNAVNNSQGTLK